jgi:hypothetical protein
MIRPQTKISRSPIQNPGSVQTSDLDVLIEPKTNQIPMNSKKYPKILEREPGLNFEPGILSTNSLGVLEPEVEDRTFTTLPNPYRMDPGMNSKIPEILKSPVSIKPHRIKPPPHTIRIIPNTTISLLLKQSTFSDYVDLLRRTSFTLRMTLKYQPYQR